MSENDSFIYLLRLLQHRDDLIELNKQIVGDNNRFSNKIDDLTSEILQLRENLRTKDLEIEGVLHEIAELKAQANYVAALNYQNEDEPDDDCATSGEDLAKSYIDDYENSPELTAKDQ